MKIKYLLLGLLLVACGKSPFLEISKTKNRSNALQANQEGLERNRPMFNAQKLKLNLYWRQGPFIGDESKLLLVLTDPAGAPYTGQDELQVKLWMPSMNHGSAPVTVTKISAGTYELSELYFIMEGDWDIHFQLVRAGEVLEEVKWRLDL